MDTPIPCPTIPSRPSKEEATFYYAGLPSSPLLVARTGSIPWKAPLGPEAYRVLKELRPAGNHPLNDVWEDNVAVKVLRYLDSRQVKWTSLDIVRICDVDSENLAPAPVTMWIGVIPGSFLGGYGVAVAYGCRSILELNNINDVEVEIRESLVIQSAGPPLLEPVFSAHPTAGLRRPLTATLGFPISTVSTPWAEGTAGFFIRKCNGEGLFLVTARHVVFPAKCGNESFVRATHLHHDVVLLGHRGFMEFDASVRATIGSQVSKIKQQAKRIEVANRGNRAFADMERAEALAVSETTKSQKAFVEEFHADVSKNWALLENRVIGNVLFSPPIDVDVGTGGYTEDFAIIEIDASKIDASNFGGNIIDLGTEFEPDILNRMMRGHHENPAAFDFPADRLFRINGTIPDNELRRPNTVDHNREPCIMVIKRGLKSGLTVGRANNIISYTRKYFEDVPPKDSKEWSIFGYDKSRAFSAKGDSGSAIVDGEGRIGGLLTGGAGTETSLDITYATPISFIMNQIRRHAFNPQIA